MPGTRSPAVGRLRASLADSAASRVAYVIADAHGSCLEATDPALELFGVDIEMLRMLRVGDLSKPDTPDSLTRQLIASCDNVGRGSAARANWCAPMARRSACASRRFG